MAEDTMPMLSYGRLFVVTDRLSGAPVDDHLSHGYECRQDFVEAVRRITGRWKGRVGECVGGRHDFLLLRFNDTPGGVPDEEWIPRYLLRPADGDGGGTSGGGDGELDDAFGFG